jgi:hypothetical protein
LGLSHQCKLAKFFKRRGVQAEGADDLHHQESGKCQLARLVPSKMLTVNCLFYSLRVTLII